jgi:hypothetical protein
MMAMDKLEQQDSSSKTPQDRRDDIIDKLHRGKLNPDQAVKEARELGLRPLFGDADPSVFDPMAKALWTPLMAFAWVASRDVDTVRKVSDEYRTKGTCFAEVGKKGNRIIYDIVQHSPATRLTLEIHLAANKNSDMTVDEAEQALTRKLIEGKNLDATGIRQGETGRSRIDSMHWEDLKFFQDEHSDTVGGRANCWHKVRLNRDNIMRLWPERSSESGSSVSVGSALSPKAGRRPLPGDEKRRAKEIKAILAAGEEERKTSPKASQKSIAESLLHNSSVKDTRFKSKDTIEKILSGRYPPKEGIKSPHKTRA